MKRFALTTAAGTTLLVAALSSAASATATPVRARNGSPR